MNNRMIINFTPGSTTLHKLTGATKVRSFIIATVFLIMSFDLRLILPFAVAATYALFSLKPNWKPIRYVFTFFMLLNLLNLFLFWIGDPGIGTMNSGGTTTILWQGSRFYLSAETAWYLLTRFCKMLASFLASMVFILSITPSEFAAGLNSIKVPYKICTIVALAYRCIPDIVRSYMDISTSMQARGMELDPKKVPVTTRLKQTVLIIIPLILSTFENVGNIANAMSLRGYGKRKKRSWYAEHEPTTADRIFTIGYIALGLFCIVYILYRMFSPDYHLLWYPFTS